MTEPLTFTLPERPPPLSACFTNAAPRFVKGGGRSKAHIGRKMTKRYEAWTRLCGLTVGYVGHIDGPVTVHYLYARTRNKDGAFSKVACDVGNLEKATSDILKKIGAIDDDSFIQKMTLEWGGDAPVRITVTPWRGEMG